MSAPQLHHIGRANAHLPTADDERHTLYSIDLRGRFRHAHARPRGDDYRRNTRADRIRATRAAERIMGIREFDTLSGRPGAFFVARAAVVHSDPSHEYAIIKITSIRDA